MDGGADPEHGRDYTDVTPTGMTLPLCPGMLILSVIAVSASDKAKAKRNTFPWHTIGPIGRSWLKSQPNRPAPPDPEYSSNIIFVRPTRNFTVGAGEPSCSADVEYPSALTSLRSSTTP